MDSEKVGSENTRLLLQSGEDNLYIDVDDAAAQGSSWDPIDPNEDTFMPSIEGLRGVAVSMTMLHHVLGESMLQHIIGGYGVDIFFTLSGFLITGVLMRLQNNDTRLSTKRLVRFYADRFIRLSPALIVMVAVMSFYWFMAGEVAPSYILHYAALALFHLTNMPSLWLKNDWGPFGNVWSLAVEEQFYLWWSLSLPFLLRVPVKIRNVVILTTIGVSFGLRIYTGLNQGSLFGLNPYLSAPTNFGKMLVGASLRLLPLPPIVKARKFAWFGFLGFFVSLCYVALLGYHPNETATHIWQSLGWVESASDLSAVFCTTLFLTGIQESGFWLLEGQSIRFLGRISYAGYLWQIPLLKRTGWNRDYTGWSTTALSLVIATISTFWIEEPLRRQYAKYKKSKVSLLDHTSSESFLPLDTGHSES